MWSQGARWKQVMKAEAGASDSTWLETARSAMNGSIEVRAFKDRPASAKQKNLAILLPTVASGSSGLSGMRMRGSQWRSGMDECFFCGAAYCRSRAFQGPGVAQIH